MQPLGHRQVRGARDLLDRHTAPSEMSVQKQVVWDDSDIYYMHIKPEKSAQTVLDKENSVQ